VADQEHGASVVSVMTFLPVLSRAKAKMRPAPPLLDIASEVRELEPGSTFEMQPAIGLPGELERITGFDGDGEFQLNRLNSAVQVEGPTLSYCLPDSQLADFTVYCRGRFSVFRSGRKRPIIIGAADRFDEAQLCTTSCAERFFGHFLREVLPLELLAEQRGITPLAFHRDPWVHEPGYRNLLDLAPVTTSFAKVRKLWITDERTLNGGWVSRFETLRARAKAKLPPGNEPLVFLRRGRLGTGRFLANEDLLADDLSAIGFRIVEPETMEPADLAATMSSARLVVCLEGSAQQHAFLAMPAGSAFLSIQPANRFNTIGRVIADRIGVRFAYVVADADGSECRLDPTRLRKTLDLLH
jgi:capsular polysaccharide biosynthesis protein